MTPSSGRWASPGRPATYKARSIQNGNVFEGPRLKSVDVAAIGLGAAGGVAVLPLDSHASGAMRTSLPYFCASEGEHFPDSHRLFSSQTCSRSFQVGCSFI
jgi:hypothetical protein